MLEESCPVDPLNLEGIDVLKSCCPNFSLNVYVDPNLTKGCRPDFSLNLYADPDLTKDCCPDFFYFFMLILT